MTRRGRSVVVVAVALVCAGIALPYACFRVWDRPVLDSTCVDTSREGWLTIAQRGEQLRMDWSPGSGRVGASNRAAAPSALVPEAEARGLARLALAPLGHQFVTPGGHPVDRLEVTLSCDGREARWAFADRSFGSKPFMTKPPLSWAERVAGWRAGRVAEFASGEATRLGLDHNPGY